MPVKYGEFLSESSVLLDGESVSEIRLRISISRAYYGLYHCALGYADTVSVPPVSDTAGPVHKKLRAFYCEDMSADKNVMFKRKQIGYRLKALAEMRCKADYNIDEVVGRVDAEAHLERCNNCVSIVEDLVSDMVECLA